MQVNGNLTLAEGGVVKNLTLPSGATFPENGNLGEQFRLTTAIDANTPVGDYSHDGTTWKLMPNIDDVLALIPTGGGVSFKSLLETRVGLGAVGAGTAVFTNGATSPVTTNNFNNAAASPLPAVWIDPADYPAGTKLRVRSQFFTNIATTASFTVSLRKVTRLSSQSSGTSLAYVMDTTALGAVLHTAPIEQASLRNLTSDEFDMPSTAGLYAFFYVQTGAMSTGAAAHISAQLQAKY